VGSTTRATGADPPGPRSVPQAGGGAARSAALLPPGPSTLALLAALDLLGTGRLGLVTPYPDDVHAAVVRTLAGEGLEVASAYDGFTDTNWELSTVPPERIGSGRWSPRCMPARAARRRTRLLPCLPW
jgi:hypothetical protein